VTDYIAFAAERGQRTDRAIDRLAPLTTAWLSAFGSDAALGDLVDAATDVWLETFEATAPEAYIDAVVGDFRALIGEALSRTTEPESPPADSQVKRIATYLATVATNDATWQAFQAIGGVRMRWVSRRDERTRTTHRAAGGQVRSVVGTFDVGGAQLRYPGDPKGPIEETIECRCVLAPAGRVQRRRGMTASADTEGFEDRTSALVVLLPEESDEANAASSEDIAHMTFVWMGEPGDEFDQEQIAEEVQRYAAGTTPITVPVERRGELGDDSADVLFLESTDSLLALRDGLVDESEALRDAQEAAEQHPQWTPHVTLGYPDAPATAEYAGEQITFDRFALWVGNERMEFPMGAGVTASAAVDVEIEDPEVEVPEDVDISDEDLVDDVPQEVPVHGVATVEGIPTGDGRGFRVGATVIPPLPAPLGFEYEYGHGGDNSKAVVVGRIDEMWRQEMPDGSAQVRYRGVIMPHKPYGNLALEGIADGSLNGVSVKIDTVTMDVAEERERFIAQLKADHERAAGAQASDEPYEPSDEEIEAIVDAFIGDGTQPVTWYSEVRPRNFDIVHMPAFVEGMIAFGHAFEDDLSDEDRAALTACGCYQPEEGDDASVIRGEDAFREVDADERKRLADEGKAMPDGSFPIANEEDLRNAIQAIGRAKDPEAAKRHIKKRAADLGKSDLIPEDWSVAIAAAGGWLSPSESLMLLTDEDRATFAPGTKDGPGWITHPRATARIRRYWVKGKGAAKIRWGAPGDFNRCRSQLAKYVSNPEWLAGLCANMHKEALGFWPGEHHSADALVAGANVERAPLFVLIEDEFEPQAIVAGAGSDWPDHFPSSAFANPGLTEETPITFTADGRVFGHLATWTACHVGMDGFCQNPPPSRDDYAHFRKGVLDTDEGPIRIGTLTYGIGHASLGASREAAVRHYDKPNAVRAYVATGEDAIGIWFAGVLKPGLTKKQIGEFKALGAVSGDWRYVGRELELIGVTAVNVPGFQIARKTALVAAAGGHQTALIPPPVVAHPNAKPIGAFSAEEAAAIARAAAREVIEEQKSRERLSAVRAVAAQVRADRLAAVREHASKGA
jgi:2'-5' RNA ligase